MKLGSGPVIGGGLIIALVGVYFLVTQTNALSPLVGYRCYKCRPEGTCPNGQEPQWDFDSHVWMCRDARPPAAAAPIPAPAKPADLLPKNPIQAAYARAMNARTIHSYY